jgi:hypothetical protein
MVGGEVFPGGPVAASADGSAPSRPTAPRTATATKEARFGVTFLARANPGTTLYPLPLKGDRSIRMYAGG